MNCSSSLFLDFPFLKHHNFSNFCSLSFFLQQVTRKHQSCDQYADIPYLIKSLIPFLIPEKGVHKGIKLWGSLAQLVRPSIRPSHRGKCLSRGHGTNTAPVSGRSWWMLPPNWLCSPQVRECNHWTWQKVLTAAHDILNWKIPSWSCAGETIYVCILWETLKSFWYQARLLWYHC